MPININKVESILQEIRNKDRTGMDIKLIQSKSTSSVYIRLRYIGTGTRVVLRISDHETSTNNTSEQIILSDNDLSYKQLKVMLDKLVCRLKIKSTYRAFNKLKYSNNRYNGDELVC